MATILRLARFFSGLLICTVVLFAASNLGDARSAFAQSKDEPVNNVIFITFGLADESGRAPAVFSDSIFLISEGESVTWQNLDTKPHQILVERAQSTSDDKAQQAAEVFQSESIQPLKEASYTFSKAGVYHVKSSTDPALTGVIAVADKVGAMTQTDTSNGVVNVKLSWYPATPRAGEDTYFRVQFLDKETGANHEHIDYTFSILDPDGKEIESRNLSHAADGQDFTKYTFNAKGDFSPTVTVRGISFAPINPDEVKFNVVVTPEFPIACAGVILASIIGSIIFYNRNVRS